MKLHAKPWMFFASGLLLGALLPGVVSVWVDESGQPYLTDREGPPTPGHRELQPGELELLWDGEVTGEPLEPGTTSFGERDRYLASVMAARSDVLRGEMKRGLRELRRLWNEHPSRPEAGYLLALVERHRGRLDEAYATISDVLRTAGELPERWQKTAEALERELEDEIALMHGGAEQSWEQRRVETPHFRIAYDEQFHDGGYGRRVGETLERVRAHMLEEFGLALDRKLDVRLYTKAHYVRNYQHRFGFATVGFYDGTIHIVSARHPRDELYALLVHEYGHALFKEAMGSHQPFFLNEGICDREEERVRGRMQVSRGEWRQMLDALRTGDWIPLATLVRGFGSVKGKRALLAYLESRAAVELIETRFPGAMGRWLQRARDGEAWEDALVAETGWDTAGLEKALQDEVRARFPADPLAAQSDQSSGAQ